MVRVKIFVDYLTNNVNVDPNSRYTEVPDKLEEKINKWMQGDLSISVKDMKIAIGTNGLTAILVQYKYVGAQHG